MNRRFSQLALLCLFAFGFESVRAQTYTYDAVGRLTQAAYPDGNAVRYNYDEADNLVSVLPVFVPVAPDHVSTSTAGAETIHVSWRDNANNESGYKIERRGPGGNEWETVANVPPGTTTFADTGLQPGTAYHYRVSATGTNGGSAFSVVSASTTEVSAAASFTTSLSTRAQVGTGSELLIPGISITGTGAKRILIRAVGPALEDHGVTGFLEDPELSVVSQGGVVLATNDDWEDSANLTELTDAFSSTFAFPLPPDSADAAVVIDLSPGLYTAVMSGKGATTGIGLVEVYDVDPDNPDIRFTSISGRARVGSGDQVLIPGFAVTGSVPQTFLVRAIGPGLEEFDVDGFLPNPELTVFSGSQSIAANDNWGEAANANDVISASNQVSAFPLGSGSLDAVVLITLDPGAYTVVVSGVGNTSGVVLVEVYQVD